MTFLLELAADYESARQIGPWLADALQKMEMPQAERAGELELAVHELAINIVDHAYADSSTGTYQIELTRESQNVCAIFLDHGKPFEEQPSVDLDVPHIRGYGLFIVEQLAEVTYERIGDENRWTLTFSPTSPQPKELT